MTRFNGRHRNGLRAVLSSLVLVGCSFQDVSPKAVVGYGPDGNGTASFAASRVTLVESRSVASNRFGLPSQVAITFRTCLVDRATTQALPGISALVTGGDRPEPVVTNAIGCADWTERVSYRHLAPERLLDWPRYVELNGERLRLSLAIDPWARGAETVIDYTDRPMPVGLVVGPDAVREALAGKGDSSPARALGREATNLEVSRLTIRRADAGQGPRGSRVEYTTSFALTAGRRGLDGRWINDERITGGNFRLTLTVWEQQSGEPAEALSRPVVIDNANVHDGLLEAKTTVEYQRVLADGAELQLHYRLEPKNGEESGLLASEGWMPLRRGHTADSGTPSLLPPASTQGGEARPGPEGPSATVGYRIQSLLVSKFKVGVARDWTLPIDVKAKVCLTLADENTPIVATSTRQFSFELSSSSRPSGNWVSADEYQANCFTVRRSDAIACELAQKERYIPMYLHVRGEEARFRGVVQTRRFAINPWQRDRQDLFFVDLPEDREPPTLEGSSAGDGVSRLMLQGLSYEFVGTTARANEFMQRVSLRQYRLTLRPKLWSPWRSHSGHDETEPVFRGVKFRVHGIFSTPPRAAVAPEASHYLGEFVSDFEVQDGGEASKTIVLPVDFPEAHRLRGAVVLTLKLTPLPLDDRRRPHARIYRLSFDPIVERGNGNSRSESSFLAREIGVGDFLSLIPTAGNVGAKGNFDGAERDIPRSPAIQRWELDGAVGYGLQPKFRGTPLDLFARYWKDTVGVRPIHLSQDRREEGWIDWTAAVPAFPEGETSPVPLPEFDRVALLRNFLEGPVARGASVKLPTPVLEGLCAYYAPGDTACASEPGRHFDAVTTFVASKVTTPDSIVAPDAAEGQFTAKIAVQASFFKETGYQERAARGDKAAFAATAAVQAKLGAENLGTGGGFFGGVGYGAEMFHSTEIGVVDGLRNRRAQTTAYELYVRKFPMDFRVDGEACLLVRPFATATERPRPALLYCTTVNNVDRSENWYELLDSAGGPPTVVGDPTNLAERGWLRTVRGDSALQRLRQRLMDDTAGAVFHKVGSWQEAFSANVTRSPEAMIEGTALDDFSKAGAMMIVGRDGGLFPGVFELHPAVAAFRENWSEKAFNEKMHAVYQGVVASGLERAQIPFIVQKNDEGQDIRVPDLVHDDKRSHTLKALRQARAYSRCLVAEYARRCSLGLYEADRPLCLARNRKDARAKLEPEIEAERKRINGACAALAKGAFP
jgi:hypothetical protein